MQSAAAKEEASAEYDAVVVVVLMEEEEDDGAICDEKVGVNHAKFSTLLLPNATPHTSAQTHCVETLSSANAGVGKLERVRNVGHRPQPTMHHKARITPTVCSAVSIIVGLVRG